MATIGQQLTAPETGWRRYDGIDSRFVYIGTWTKETYTGCYNNTYAYTSELNAEVKFKFKGTKLRIICTRYTNRTNNVEVRIDGTLVGTINEYTSNTNGIVQTLEFEMLGLTDVNHQVSIKSNSATTYTFDCIDIDNTGYLVHPKLNQVTDINSMQIGDCIPIRYTALTSGAVGTFSELGTCIKDEIPTTCGATSDGLAYLIHSGYDVQGRMKLVFDRNLQHSISWDTLNSSGMADGEGLPLNLLGQSFNTAIRLIDDGISSIDKDNEWDQLINNNSLNGLITPADSSIWNFVAAVRTWTGGYLDATHRTIRWMSELRYDIDSYSLSSYVGTLIGYRPVLIVESLNASPIIANITKSFINNNLQCQLSEGTISDPDVGNLIKYKVSITKPDSTIIIKRDYDSSFQNSPLTFNAITFDNNEFDVGVNTIIVEATDNQNPALTCQWTATVTKTDTLKILFQDGLKWKYINGGSLVVALTDYTSGTDTDKQNALLTYGMNDNINNVSNIISQLENNDFSVIAYKVGLLS